MDNIIKEVGPFGLFQKISLTLIGCITSLVAMTFYITIFNTSDPALVCNFLNQTKTNETIDTCMAWKNQSVYTCKFDQEFYGTTIVNDWELLCEKSYLVALTQTLFLIGGVSGFISGYVSDKYGRKRASIIFLALFQIVLFGFNILTSDLVGLSNSYRLLVYCVFQFLNGALNICIFNSTYVLLIELTSQEYHQLFSNINIYFYVIGEVIIMGAYYFSRNWLITNYFLTIYSLVFLILFWIFLPESPMWLIECERFEESAKVLKRIARINRVNYIPNRGLEMKRLVQKENDPVNLPAARESSSVILKELFCSLKNILKLGGLFFVYCSVNLNYFSVAIGVTTVLKINPYLMYLLSSLFEFIGVVLCHLNDRIGRRKGMIFYFMSSTLSSLLFALLPDDSASAETKWFLLAKITLSLLARLMISAAFNTLIIFSAELYEVKTRTTVLMLLSALGQVGSLLSPTVNTTRELWDPLPHFIYALLGFFSTVLIFLLPETHH